MRILELFGGIGACTQAFKNLGVPLEIVDYVEIDKYAVASYNAMNNTNYEPQDITQYYKHFDNVDLISHGSPCQDFSIAGKQAGGDQGSGTRSSLMYETLRIVQDIMPKYVIWENVKNLLSSKHRHNFDQYIERMNEIGYNSYYQVLNAKDYGVPQNRDRVYTISIRKDIDKGTFKFPEKEPLLLRLKDVLEDEVEEKYYLSDSMKRYISSTGTEGYHNHDSKINLDIARPITTDPNKRAGTSNYISNDVEDNYNLSQIRMYGIFDSDTSKHQAGSVYDKNGLSPTLDTMQGGWRQPLVEELEPKVVGGVGEKQSNSGRQWYQQDRIYDGKVALSMSTVAQPYYKFEGIRIRKLTPRECWRLMTFPDEAFDKVKDLNSNTQLYKQAGNSIVVKVLEKIFKNLLEGEQNETSDTGVVW